MNQDVSILIVDDSEDDRYILKRQLKRLGFSGAILEASDGSDAVQFLQEAGSRQRDQTLTFPPIAIVLDINMPVIGGFEFLARFETLRKQNPALQTCMLIMFSSSDREDDIQRAFSFDCVKEYIVKGRYTADELKQKLSAILPASS